ncbi:MAG: hypothetical protein QW578_06525 [Thermoplasmatales archaeon]
MGYSPPSSSYSPLLLSHQTGLSITATTANTFYAIGTTISVPRSGIAVINMMGSVGANSGTGLIQLSLTRGSSTYLFGNSTISLFANIVGNGSPYSGIMYTTPSPLFINSNYLNDSESFTFSQFPFLLPVYSGDSLQFYAGCNVANEAVNINDMLVILL